jgi:hypothetical protein
MTGPERGVPDGGVAPASRRAYSCRVLASPAVRVTSVLLAAAFGVAAAATDVTAGRVGLLAAALGVLAATAWLGTVRVLLGAGQVQVGHGLSGGYGYAIPAARVAGAEAITLTWPQVFGFGLPTGPRDVRMTVRPGPTLVLTLDDGVRVRVSVPDPALAAHFLTHVSDGGAPGPATGRATPGLGVPSRRPWFGPKHTGWGLRPLTWQGWTLTGLLVGAAILALTLG